MAHLNFLEPHLEAGFKVIGLAAIRFVRVDFEELWHERFKQAMSDAELALDEIVDQIPNSTNLKSTP